MAPNSVIPASGEILRALVRALDVSSDSEVRAVLSSKNKTTTRFFEGDVVDDPKRIYRAMAAAFADCGWTLGPDRPAPPFQSRELDAGLLQHLARTWDLRTLHVRTALGSVDAPGALIETILRLTTIDLGVRIGLRAALQGHEPSFEVPTWAREHGRAGPLRRLVEASGLTREALARRVGVSDNTVDSWMQGDARPTGDRARRIEAVLVPGDQPAAQALERHFALWDLVDGVAARIGWDAVEECGQLLAFTARTSHRAFRSRGSLDVSSSVGGLLAGTGMQLVVDYLAASGEPAPDPLWATELRLPSDELAPRVHQAECIAKEVEGLDVDTSTRTRLVRWALTDGLPIDDAAVADGTPKRTAWLLRARAHEAQRRQAWDDGIELAHSSLRLERFEPETHMVLATCLFGKGCKAAALEEARLAIALRPEDELPWIAAGVLLRELDEAELLEHFNRAIQLAGRTPWIAFERAKALMARGALEEAVVDLRFLDEQRPGNLAVLDRLHACLDAMGRSAEAELVARRASVLGSERVFRFVR